MLASLYVRKRDVAAAEAALREAVAREPKSVEARLALGDFYVLKRDGRQAEEEFRPSLHRGPDRSVTIRLSGESRHLAAACPA